jgi:hypothetical protein
VLKDM